MNVPFQCVHFIVYEAMQNATNPERVYNPMGHVVSGGVSGALAAAITTPLDVCKTLLNTQVRFLIVESEMDLIKLKIDSFHTCHFLLTNYYLERIEVIVNLS